MTLTQYPYVVFLDKSVGIEKSSSKCICLAITSTDDDAAVTIGLAFSKWENGGFR
jgi:hypothetical protein